MRMDVNVMLQHQPKIQQLFQKFLEVDFEIKNDTYLNRLLTHLSNQEKPVDATLADNPFFSEWLLQAVSTWETEKIFPSTNVASFTLNLASIISRSEHRFCTLEANSFFPRLLQIVKARQPDVAPSIKLGYVKLLKAFLEHQAGVRWIMNCDLWMDVLRFTLSGQTVYITKEGYRFMAKILEQTIDVDEAFSHNVVKEIMSPLRENTYKTIRTTDEMMEISDEVAYRSLSPTLLLVADILEYLLESVLFAQNDCRILLVFLRDFHLEQLICNFMMIAQNKHLVFDLGKIIFIMQFLEIYLGVLNGTLKTANVVTSVRKIMSIFTTNTSRGNFENVMKLCFHGQCYWNLVGYKIPCVKVNKDNEPISFANQLLVLQILPISAIAMKYCMGDSEELFADEFRDQYVQKLFMMMCENTIRIAYGWRDFLVAQPNLFEIATKGLIYVMKSRKYYPRERAAMAFQAFVYALKDVMRAVKEAPEKMAFFAQQVSFFSLLFDAFVVFIEEFQITWRDSVETICVMSISFDFLSVPTWPTQLVVKALKLVNVSLVKYMSPNLALLVDRTTDSTLAVLGPLLGAKLCDMTWEVRDSALEVVCTISHMSSTKVEPTVPIFTRWLQRAVVKWCAAGIHLRPDVASFVLDLVALLAKDEDRFCGLNANNFFVKLVNVSKARSAAEEEVKMSYIGLLSSCLEHTSGVEWTVSCNFWEDVYRLCLTEENERVMAEATDFMSKILDKTVDLDEGFCNEAVKKVMQPLGENIYRAIKTAESMMEVSEEVASVYLKPTLRLMGAILEKFLEGVYFGRKDFGVGVVFLKNFHLEERISDFMIIAQARCLAFDIAKIMFVMQFLEMYVKTVTNSVSAANVGAAIRRMQNNYMVNISKGNFESVVEFSGFAQIFWHLVDSKLSLKQSSEGSFADEMFLFLILPPYCILLKFCWEKDQIIEILEDEFRDRFIHKVFKIMSQDAVRACYYWRENIIARSDTFKVCALANDQIRRCRRYLSRESAIFAAQTLIYFLDDFVSSVKEFQKKLDPFLTEMSYFSQVFQNLVDLFEDFHITWQDSLEATNVLTIAFDFLMVHTWPKWIVVQVLKLINVATAKYMAPNLALLLDSTTDCTVALLGPLLFAYLHDEVEEVKCAALEVVRTMARMSNTDKHEAVALKPDNYNNIQRILSHFDPSNFFQSVISS